MVESSFGNRLLHLLSNESRDIVNLIEKLQECKSEVDQMFQMMRVALSNSGGASSLQRQVD